MVALLRGNSTDMNQFVNSIKKQLKRQITSAVNQLLSHLTTTWLLSKICTMNCYTHWHPVRLLSGTVQCQYKALSNGNIESNGLQLQCTAGTWSLYKAGDSWFHAQQPVGTFGGKNGFKIEQQQPIEEARKKFNWTWNWNVKSCKAVGKQFGR